MFLVWQFYLAFFSHLLLLVLFFQSTLLIYSMSISLSTTAAFHHHVLIVFQHHTFLLVQVEEGDGAKGRWHTAGPWHGPVYGVDQCLHHSMARWIHMVSQWEAALSEAKESIVTRRGHDPFIPTYIFEVHVQRVSTAASAGEPFELGSPPTISFHSPFIPSHPPTCVRALTPITLKPAPGPSAPASSASRGLLFEGHKGLAAAIVTVSHQQWPLPRPAVLILPGGPAHPQMSLLGKAAVIISNNVQNERQAPWPLR